MFGSQEILGSLSPCSPVCLGEISAPYMTPRYRLMSPFMHSLLRHEPGETDDCAPCSQRKALQKLGWGREDLGRSQEWTRTGELGERVIKRDLREMDTVQNQVEADTDRLTKTERPAKTDEKTDGGKESNKITR